MKCRHCDQEIGEGIKFCPFCGKEINPADYCVIVLESEKSDLQLIKILHDRLKLNLSQATQMAKRLPFTMYSDLHEDEAEKIVAELEAEGITAIVDRTPAEEQNSAPAVKEAAVAPEQPKKPLSSGEIANYAEKKKILFNATVIDTVAAMITVLVTLFILLLPIFNTYSTSIGDAEVKSESLLTVVISATKSVLKNISDTNRGFLDWMYFALKISLVVSAVMLIVSATKTAVSKTKRLISFEEYCAKELTAKSILRFTPNVKSNMIYKVAFDFALTAFILGYKSVIWSTVAIIAVIAVIGLVVEKIGDYQRKKALKID